jgi:antitoxin ParD1/3/4
MNVSFPIPKELESYVEEQIESGTYASVTDYFLALLNQDRQKKDARARLTSLLKEGMDSKAEPLTSAYWQDLRLSVLG